MKKILFIIWSYSYGGGAESLLTMIVNHLNPEKYDISIIEFHHAEIKKEPVNKNIHVLPYIEAVDTPEKYSKTYQLYQMPDLLIERYIRKNYDLYVSFNYLIPTFLLPRDTKNIAWIHSDVYDLRDKKVQREWARQDAAFEKVKQIVAISDLTEQSLYELFPRHKSKIIKIYNGIDVEQVRKSSMEPSPIQINFPSVLFVGRLEQRKDPVRLVKVLKLVHDYGEKIHLYYMGNGDQEKIIKQQADEENILEYVHFLGYQVNPFPIMRQADVVCLLSKQEGFSMSLLESVALNVPFVATSVGGAKELSNHRCCGDVVETDEEAAKAICNWISMDKTKIAEECQRSIKRFELSYYIKEIERLFDKVIDE